MNDEERYASLKRLGEALKAVLGMPLEPLKPAPAKPKKAPSSNGPWLKRKEAVAMLGARSVLEAVERAGWLKAAVRRRRLVLYNRQEVLACVYRLSQGEYPV